MALPGQHLALWKHLDVVFPRSDLTAQGLPAYTMPARERAMCDAFIMRFPRHVWTLSEGRCLIQHRKVIIEAPVVQAIVNLPHASPDWPVTRHMLADEGIQSEIYDSINCYVSKGGFPNGAEGVSGWPRAGSDGGLSVNFVAPTQPDNYGTQDMPYPFTPFVDTPTTLIPVHEWCHQIENFFPNILGVTMPSVDLAGNYVRASDNAAFSGGYTAPFWLRAIMRRDAKLTATSVVSGVSDAGWSAGTPTHHP